MSKKSTQLRLRFTRREKRGALILAFLAIILILLPKFFKSTYPPLAIELTYEEKQKVEQLHATSKQAKAQKKKAYSNNFKNYEKKEKINPIPTEPFDPDTLTIESWRKLGLSERQAEIMLSYRERSNGFYHIDQLYSAYVLDSEKVNLWKPFLVFNRKKPVAKKIEINSASAEEFKSLKGIGDKLSERIVAYRTKLGGFVRVEQIGEVYGLPAETFEEIKTKLTVDPTNIQQVMVNHLEIKELAGHPYISFQMAKLIVNYRLQHGPYLSIEDLLKSKGLEKEEATKIEPYINFAP